MNCVNRHQRIVCQYKQLTESRINNLPENCVLKIALNKLNFDLEKKKKQNIKLNNYTKSKHMSKPKINLPSSNSHIENCQSEKPGSFGEKKG